MSQSTCGYTGNSDLYGLGVRLGTYLLWYSVQIAAAFRLEGAQDLLVSWNIFALALSAAIYILTFQQQDPDQRAHPADIAIVLYMIFGGCFGTLSFAVMASKSLPTQYQILLSPLTCLLALVYAAWFWISGINDDQFQHSQGCYTYVFLFSKVSPEALRSVSTFFAFLAVWFSMIYLLLVAMIAYNNITSFTMAFKLKQTDKLQLLNYINSDCHEVLINFFSKYTGLPREASLNVHLEDITRLYLVVRIKPGEPKQIIHLGHPLTNLRDKLKVRQQLEEILDIWKVYSDDFDENVGVEHWGSILQTLLVSQGTISIAFLRDGHTAGRYISYFMYLIGFIYTSYALIAIELMVIWNDIDGVYSVQSTGQLIPLIVGILSFLKTIHDVIFNAKVNSTSDCSEN
jgi:hypothetical protein